MNMTPHCGDLLPIILEGVILKECKIYSSLLKHGKRVLILILHQRWNRFKFTTLKILTQCLLLLGELYVPCILYGNSSSGVLHEDPPWAPRSNARTDIGTGCTSIDSKYASGYFYYFFGGSSIEYPEISKDHMLGLRIMSSL